MKEDTGSRTYNTNIIFKRLFIKKVLRHDHIKFNIGFIVKKPNIRFDKEQLDLYLNNKSMKKCITLKKGVQIGCYWISSVVMNLDMNSVFGLAMQNSIKFVYIDNEGQIVKKPLKYAFKEKTKFKSTNVLKFGRDRCCYFWQTKKNNVQLAVRNLVETDKRSKSIKVGIAYWIARCANKCCGISKKILLFEKDSARYEESASVLFEHLIDQGYKDSYFILDKDYKWKNRIEKKYRENIIEKYSFKHFYYFFRSSTFLGTEALIHAAEVRSKNRYILKKVNSSRNNYVFLQHGVMYMISLDAKTRAFFKPPKVSAKGKYRVVASSEMEAKHFINYGNFDPSQVIVSGLPKFDRNLWCSDADKIAIMPTWRPWEYNEMVIDIQSSGYYQLLYKIVANIPSELMDKIMILPHPLFMELMKTQETPLTKYLAINEKYDDLLKRVKLLITDYSSISYDAFYRGANVIFVWKDLEKCLHKYGNRAKLMLNEQNTFGDICYDLDALKELVESNYYNGQIEKYRLNYKKIVQFCDGKNTERLINQLKSEGII